MAHLHYDVNRLVARIPRKHIVHQQIVHQMHQLSSGALHARHRHELQAAPRHQTTQSVMERPVQRVGELISKSESYIAHDVLGGWSPADMPDMTGKVVMVTGASSGIGYETCRKLAEKGAKVLMIIRTREEGLETAARIRQAVGNAAEVEPMVCDLSKLSNVVALAKEFTSNNQTLDVLIHVAGTFYPAPLPGPGRTEDGIEQTLAVNYYAPTLLTLCLLDTLNQTPGSRVVFMSSGLTLIGQVPWDGLKGEHFKTSGLLPYSNSKLMLTLWAAEFARRAPQLDVYAVHPGFVKTPMYDKASKVYPGARLLQLLSKVGACRPAYGAWSTLYAASEPSIQGKGFKFFAPSLLAVNLWPTKERPFWISGRVANQELARRLWEATQGVFDKSLGRQSPPRIGL